MLAASYPALMRDAYPPDLLTACLPLMIRPQPALLASGRFYLAMIDGAAAGCGGWSLERPGAGETAPGLAHIRHFAVRPDRLRRGVGRALYARCARDAAAAGVDRFECWSSLNGEAFYAALGFETREAVEIPMGPGGLFPSIRMEAPVA